MVVRIGDKPEGSFTNPLGLLNDCHRRIESFLRMLITVTAQAQGAELNREQRSALESSLSYFKEAAPKHTMDEEGSLFPRMRAVQGGRVKAAFAKIEALEKDHKVAEACHGEVESLGRRWLVEGSLSAEAVRRLAERLDELFALYRRHIQVEETEVFPLAGKILEPSEIEAIGREMAGRRGIALEA